MTTTSTTRCFNAVRRAASDPRASNLDFFIGIDAGLFDHHARGDVRCGAEAADAQGFALEVFQCFELRLSDQRHRPIIEKAGDDSYRQAGNRAADDGAEQLAVVDVPCRQGGDRDVGIHPNDLSFEILVFEQPVFLRHRDRQVRHIRIGHRDANPFQRHRRRAEEDHDGDQDW